MKSFHWVAGAFCLGLAVVILLFAEGLRRWYSGGFFLVMGVAMLLTKSCARADGGADAASSDQGPGTKNTET